MSKLTLNLSLVIPKAFSALLPTFEQIRRQFTAVTATINNPDSGATTARPTAQLTMGQFFYDTTLNKPIWWNSTSSTWKDATGTNV